MQSNKQNQNDTVDAIRHRQAERSEHITPQSEELEHEEKDLSYVDENRLTFGKILKYIGIGLVILVFALLFYRMSAQNKDYSDYFVWTDSILAAYEEKHDLSAKIQNMSSYQLTLARDENNIPTDVLTFTYYPYSDPKPAEKGEDFEGCYMVSMPMYIEDTKDLLITFRVNRTAGAHLKTHYSLDHEPTGDVYRFSLSDGKTTYTEYDYLTFSENSYYYYRLVFKNVDYRFVTGYQNIKESDIIELDLSVYYNYRFNEKSPIVTMTVANSYCPSERFDVKDALPAKMTPDLKPSPEWKSDEEKNT
ncbi:MAG: hypothetical protein IKC63_08645 [Clostridia bacterium]|nr:hypothetical protein [Clostridia bacterium]